MVARMARGQDIHALSSERGPARPPGKLKGAHFPYPWYLDRSPGGREVHAAWSERDRSFISVFTNRGK